MFPIKMIYQPTQRDTAKEILVYSILPSISSDGNIIEPSAVCWDSSCDMWITTPMWCLKPIINKVLCEG